MEKRVLGGSRLVLGHWETVGLGAASQVTDVALQPNQRAGSWVDWSEGRCKAGPQHRACRNKSAACTSLVRPPYIAREQGLGDEHFNGLRLPTHTAELLAPKGQTVGENSIASCETPSFQHTAHPVHNVPRRCCCASLRGMSRHAMPDRCKGQGWFAPMWFVPSKASVDVRRSGDACREPVEPELTVCFRCTGLLILPPSPPFRRR